MKVKVFRCVGVSPFANRKLKSLSHLCAISALRWDKEIKAYYERKVLEGKNKMSVINAIRNKLLLRIFVLNLFSKIPNISELLLHYRLRQGLAAVLDFILSSPELKPDKLLMMKLRTKAE